MFTRGVLLQGSNPPPKIKPKPQIPVCWQEESYRAGSGWKLWNRSSTCNRAETLSGKRTIGLRKTPGEARDFHSKKQMVQNDRQVLAHHVRNRRKTFPTDVSHPHNGALSHLHTQKVRQHPCCSCPRCQVLQPRSLQLRLQVLIWSLNQKSLNRRPECDGKGV